MSNVYVSVDPCWSYNFLGGLKDELRDLDLFKFTNDVYRLIADFVKISHNFRLTNNAVLFNEAMQSIWKDLELMGDIPVPYFQVSFRQLFNTHLASFNSLQGHIKEVVTITSPQGDLTGFVFALI